MKNGEQERYLVHRFLYITESVLFFLYSFIDEESYY